ncbi:MAG: 50S ribosomal protein L22, partial [Candidatus Paceibacteria bacterium]
MEVSATAKQIRMSPRKMRIVADAIRGKSVQDAHNILYVSEKKAADHIKKVLKSAESNASHNYNLSSEQLYIRYITV